MRLIIVICFFVISSLLACDFDKKEVDMNKVEGRWSMEYAERNGNPTNTLDNAFFDINAEYFSHNLNGDSVGLSYTIKDESLIFEDELLQNLEILELVKDTLFAKTKISNFSFKFLMSRDVVK